MLSSRLPSVAAPDGAVPSGRYVPLVAIALVLSFASPGAAIVLPAGFQEEVAFTGLYLPTAVRFAADGRVFVAEKSGYVKVFSGVGDPTPDIAADLRTNVHSWWDRGLLGMALHPNFPAVPFVYVLYTYNALPGGVAPLWPTSNGSDDSCPNPPGGTADGCVVSGRLSRLEVNASNQQVGPEVVLVENNWCQQFPSHALGDLTFGADGALYASAGDGASFNNADYGQFGGTLPNSTTPVTLRNPCGDPPGGPGGAMSAPTAEGGALRSQDLRTSGDATTFDGSLLRVDPMTGGALPDNPLWGGVAMDDDRIVAYGLRNPFRVTVRPGTSEVWIGDVGWNGWEEINRVDDPVGLNVRNFGWPCYEGVGRHSSYDAANLNICETLYTANADSKPYFAYAHGNQPGAAACRGSSSSISGLAFYAGGTYPGGYENALFYSDYSRGCIWVLSAGAGGLPDPATVQTFASGVAAPVALERGPGGDLYYVDLNGGSVRRIRYLDTNHPPVAVAQADTTAGPSPLLVQFDASASGDPDAGDTLSYAWDLDGDGAYDDSNAIAPTLSYTAGSYVVGLRVSDNHGASATAQLTINVANSAPTATITSPLGAQTWSVGDPIVLAGGASDPDQGALPPGALHWQIIMHHCPDFDCHAHTIEELSGASGGIFFAPDHEYPSFIEIRLTASDSGGLSHTASVELQPKTVTLAFASVPSGLALAVGPASATTPFQRVVIVGSSNSLSAPSPQPLLGVGYQFTAWSDGGAAAHDIVAAAVGQTYTATFAPTCGDGGIDPGETCDDGNLANGDCCSAQCQLEPAGTICRGAAGVCDVAETCSGSSPSCPANVRLTSVCRAAAGTCDAAEACTGASDTCPADAFAPATQSCRAAAGACDLAESCTGTGAACPADAKRTTVCRSASGLCDVAESCDGVNAVCPPDAVLPNGSTCRADAGECDAAEICDGSSAACPTDRAEPVGAPCTDDGNVCTADACDGLGACAHAANSAPCDDGNPCTTGDQCGGAACVGAPVDCDDGNPCTQDACAPLGGGCSHLAAPRSGCRTAQKSKLLIRQRDGVKDRFNWRWVKGAETSGDDFADPSATADYSLCLFAGGAVLAAVEVPASATRWHSTGSTGWAYDDAGGGADGITKMRLKGAATDRAKILIKGAGANLPDPIIGGVATPLRVQLVNRQTDVCWESAFDAADVTRDDPAMLQAARTQP